ncbi:MAG: chemotaxis protein MotA [Chlamydiales bacterium]|jgi:chemotaxis protein MotA
MDTGTIIGFAGAWGLVFMGMLLATGGDFGLVIALFIYQPSSAAITIGGSMLGVVMVYPLEKVTKIGGVFGMSFNYNPKITALKELVLELVDYATEARRNGVLALDARTEDIEDPFIKGGIQLAVDGTAPEQIAEIMNLELDALQARHQNGQGMVLKWAELGPAFGMIGTLVGLVAMLANLDNPDTIGPAMAVALITTLYGSMLANMLCIPLVGKLQERTKEEVVYKQMIIAAILAIQNGDNPRIVQKKLLTYVTADIKEEIEAESGGE